LTETGRQRCQQAAAELAAYQLSRIVTSTELKAIETGELIGQSLGIPVTQFDGLQEQLRETAGYQPTPADFEAAIIRLFEQPDTLVYGEETANQALQRFTQACESVIAGQPTGDIALVSHGTVISLFVAAKTGCDPIAFWRQLRQPALVVFSLPDFNLIRVVNDFQTE
jgi:broad specificity phosphatase PhoE